MTTRSKLFTYDDWLNLPKDCYKYEVLDGKLIERESPPTIHQMVSGSLLFLLAKFIKENNIGEVLAGLDVALSMTDIVQPDLVFVSKERRQIITEKNIIAAPDLVVEIIDKSTKTIDQSRKKDLYEKHGVEEYWLVYPDEHQVEQFILEDEAFLFKGKLGESDTLNSEVISGFSMALEEIFTSE